MTKDAILKHARRFAIPYRVTNGGKFHLKDYDPADTLDFKKKDKSRAEEALAVGVEALSEMQDMLYAQDKWGVLLIFQAMDAAGKDGAIKHVMSGVNPQGCEVYSFKTPSRDDLDHDFMWRYSHWVPERGRIGIFNRSYYEETLIVRVHPSILTNQQIPPQLVTKNIWKERFQDICNFENYLHRNGIITLKFFLNLSKEEQKRRFLARIDTPEKNWKFSSADIHERQFWDDYQNAYEKTIRNTATKESPWYVVPADNKWFSRVVVAAAVIDALSNLNLAYPEISPEQKADLEKARAELLAE